MVERLPLLQERTWPVSPTLAYLLLELVVVLLTVTFTPLLALSAALELMT